MSYAVSKTPTDSVEAKKTNDSQAKHAHQLNILRTKTPLPIGYPLKGTIPNSYISYGNKNGEPTFSLN